MDATLTPDESASRLSGTGFRHRGDQLEVHYRTPDFASGLRLLVEVGALAESLQHHPEVRLGWGRLEFTLSSHDAGGVTDRDVALARGIHDLAEAAGLRPRPHDVAL